MSDFKKLSKQGVKDINYLLKSRNRVGSVEPVILSLKETP